ncbi:MAG TPA: zinc-dependent alcohol dehydrogenase family protein [Verrucomicrobiae bacterium]|jgi:alcohol dehydrogenase, propanol-preferring|nr:zinc-dependent alcohol dehydrogenase family protein [Verrucomicrobiae bacterium]
MRAMLLRAQASIGTAPLEAVEMAPPTPGPGEVRVRVHCCATCRTDLHVVEGDLVPRRLPIVPGHQAVGTVEALGPGAGRLRSGDRVGVAWLRSTCGACAFCTTGRENLCEGSRYTGWTDDGGYAQYCCVPEAFAYPIPDAFDDAEAAPLLCAGIIGYRALRRSQLAPGARLALYGFGSSAHITLQVARHRGCVVYVSTRDAAHRALALSLGARWAGRPGEPLPDRVDSAIVFAPAGDLVPIALQGLEKGGTVALAGIHMTDVPAMAYEPNLFWEKTLQSVTANTRSDGLALLAEAAAIPIRPRITRYALADANTALQDLAGDRVAGTAVLMVD